ncbi:MAG: DUF5668 domain-containing protein [Lachnospiraceae bacterium]
MKERRVGTITLGCMLVLFGILFLAQLFTQAISYGLIFRLWPIVFILLGIEVLLSQRQSENWKFKLDAGAIFLLFLLMGFAIGMAGLDFFIQHQVPELFFNL